MNCQITSRNKNVRINQSKYLFPEPQGLIGWEWHCTFPLSIIILWWMIMILRYEGLKVASWQFLYISWEDQIHWKKHSCSDDHQNTDQTEEAIILIRVSESFCNNYYIFTFVKLTIIQVLVLFPIIIMWLSNETKYGLWQMKFAEYCYTSLAVISDSTLSSQSSIFTEEEIFDWERFLVLFFALDSEHKNCHLPINWKEKEAIPAICWKKSTLLSRCSLL